MKTYNITKRRSRQARYVLEHIIDTHEKYKNCYFWNSDNGNTAFRERRERQFDDANPNVCFIKSTDKIEVSLNFSQSRKNTYYSLSIYVNGEKKNISIIKNLLKK